MTKEETIVEQTKKWINDVVIGCNFCPFASKVVKQNKVFYQVENSSDKKIGLTTFLQQLKMLDNDNSLETSFLIFSEGYKIFDIYLDLVAAAEELLIEDGYEGIYQVASFHPQYLFAGSNENDSANYTNRSIYPMLHLLREASIDVALENYKNPENIPNTNIDFAKEKGIVYMKMLRDSCL